MDDLVSQAIARWPNVPHCHGWLGLDGRGHWWLRDAAAQVRGTFASRTPGARGTRLQHERLIDFIGRNYQADDQGCWHFQNGPQRVYVELEVAPWIWRVQPDGAVVSHTGRAAQVHEVLLDEAGRLFLATDLGPGLVHSQDMGLAAAAVERGAWVPKPVDAASLAARYGFVLSPQAGI